MSEAIGELVARAEDIHVDLTPSSTSDKKEAIK